MTREDRAMLSAQELFGVAEKEKGAYVNNQRIGVSKRKKLILIV